MPHKTDPTLTPAAVAIYEAVRQAVHDFAISPSQSELATATSYSIQTVRNALALLRQKGYVDFEKFGARAVSAPRIRS